MKTGIEGAYDRLGRSALAEMIVKTPETVTALTIDDSKLIKMVDKGDNRTYSYGPLGAIPFAMSATPEELREAAERNSTAKYWYMDKGDYYRSWKCAWRQKMFEQILEGITQFSLLNQSGTPYVPPADSLIPVEASSTPYHHIFTREHTTAPWDHETSHSDKEDAKSDKEHYKDRFGARNVKVIKSNREPKDHLAELNSKTVEAAARFNTKQALEDHKALKKENKDRHERMTRDAHKSLAVNSHKEYAEAEGQHLHDMVNDAVKKHPEYEAHEKGIKEQGRLAEELIKRKKL